MLLCHSDVDAWLSLVERCVRDAEVAGSNPVASIPWQGRRKAVMLAGFRFFFLSVNNVGNIGCKALFYKTSKSNSSAALDDIDKNSRLFG